MLSAPPTELVAKVERALKTSNATKNFALPRSTLMDRAKLTDLDWFAFLRVVAKSDGQVRRIRWKGEGRKRTYYYASDDVIAAEEDLAQDEGIRAQEDAARAMREAAIYATAWTIKYERLAHAGDEHAAARALVHAEDVTAAYIAAREGV